MKPEILRQRQTEDQLARALNIVHTIFNHLDVKWFVSFGSLLYFIRDRNMGVPYEQDIDISILGKCDHKKIIHFMDQWSYEVSGRVINDQTKDPFQLVFKSKSLPFCIDVFFWKKYNDYWWHTYDYYGEHPKKGVPSKYVFKGTPKWMMRGEVFKYNWEEITGNMNFPHLYGTLLDYWYSTEKSGWLVPDKSFGQSKGLVLKLKNCKNLEKELKCPEK